jgi:vacuolar-type H+-ATPase subunit I/STV1
MFLNLYVCLLMSFVNYFRRHVTFEMFVKKLVMFVRYVGSMMYVMVLRCM